MTRLDCYKCDHFSSILNVPIHMIRTAWWNNIFKSVTAEPGYCFADRITEIAKEWNAEWEYSGTADGVQTVFPTALVFEREDMAALFLLRWS